jgi:hypothetical protein
MSEVPSGRIVKVEDDKKLVFGWASIIKTETGELLLDRQNDFVDDSTELEKSAYNYVLHSRDGGEMHVRKGVSTLVESVVLTDEKQKALGIEAGTVPTGWWIGFKVNDDRVWEQVKKGDYVGFSVHGSGRREPVALANIGKYTEIGKEDKMSPKQTISKYIKRKPDGTYCVYSEKGKLMGEYKSKAEAEKRLAQIERFSKYGSPTVSSVHEDSTNWKAKKKKRKRKTEEALEKFSIEKFNQNHDEVGRFTTADNNTTGKGGGSSKKRAPKKPAGKSKRRPKTTRSMQREMTARVKARKEKEAAVDARMPATKKPNETSVQGYGNVNISGGRWRKGTAKRGKGSYSELTSLQRNIIEEEVKTQVFKPKLKAWEAKAAKGQAKAPQVNQRQFNKDLEEVADAVYKTIRNREAKYDRRRTKSPRPSGIQDADIRKISRAILKNNSGAKLSSDIVGKALAQAELRAKPKEYSSTTGKLIPKDYDAVKPFKMGKYLSTSWEEEQSKATGARAGKKPNWKGIYFNDDGTYELK